MLLLKFVNDTEEWKKIYLKCWYNGKKINFDAFLGLPLDEKSRNDGVKLVADQIKDLELILGLATTKIELEQLSSIHTLLNKYDKNKDFLSGLIKLCSFVLLNNNGAAIAKIKEIINLDFKFYSFESDWWNILSNESRQIVLETTYRSLKMLASSSIPKIQLSIFFQYINALDPGDRIKSLIGSNDLEITLAELRKMANSNFWGNEIAFTWFIIFLHRTFEAEAFNYLNEQLPKIVMTKDIKQLWGYVYSFPIENKRRIELIESLKMAKKDLGDYEYFLKILFMESEIVRNELGVMIPLFQLKRDYFQSLLIKEKAIFLAVYNLSLLNDNNQNLWKNLYNVAD